MPKHTASPSGVHGLASIFTVLLIVNSSRGTNCRILPKCILVHGFGLQFTTIVNRELRLDHPLCPVLASFRPTFDTPGLVSPVGS
ncbi:unnamed protein product [Linum trigynum]|uniref:Secreted protein n=1 Tax=Linum trigynum TaxID=586398 RepID=A0AAV2CKZ5_9ROSI